VLIRYRLAPRGSSTCPGWASMAWRPRQRAYVRCSPERAAIKPRNIFWKW